MEQSAPSRWIFDIRERRKALEKQLRLDYEPGSSQLTNVTASAGASTPVSVERPVSGIGDNFIERQHQNEVLDLRKRLTESESRNVMLQRRLEESEMAREGLEQLHIDLQAETRRQREDQLATEGRESIALSRVNEDLSTCRDELEVFKRLERKLGRYSAIRRHIQSSLIPEDSNVIDETRSDLLHWGTDEEDTMQDLAMHSPHLLEYFQYLTGKVLEYETKLKGLRGELNADRDTMERDAAYAEKLSAEVERYEEMISAMDLLHTGYKARITELESGIQTKSDADVALQKVRECLVTYPGGLKALFEAISFDVPSLLHTEDVSSSSSGEKRRDKYRYSNNFEKSRRAARSKVGPRKKDGTEYGPAFNRLIGGDDGLTLASLQDDDLPVIVSRVMIHNAAAVSKVPTLEARLQQQKKEILNLEKIRDGQQARLRELEWRMRHTEEEKENDKRRLQSALTESVAQVEQQNNFVMNLEDRLDSLNSQVHERELNIRHLQKKLSQSLSTAGQAPGEDMTLEDLIDITNNALLYEQHYQRPPALPHKDALGHTELVTSSSDGFPDTPPRSTNLNARIRISPSVENSSSHQLGDHNSTRAMRTLERLIPEDPTNIEFKLKEAQAKLSGLKEI